MIMKKKKKVIVIVIIRVIREFNDKERVKAKDRIVIRFKDKDKE